MTPTTSLSSIFYPWGLLSCHRRKIRLVWWHLFLTSPCSLLLVIFWGLAKALVICASIFVGLNVESLISALSSPLVPFSTEIGLNLPFPSPSVPHYLLKVPASNSSEINAKRNGISQITSQLILETGVLRNGLTMKSSIPNMKNKIFGY